MNGKVNFFPQFDETNFGFKVVKSNSFNNFLNEVIKLYSLASDNFDLEMTMNLSNQYNPRVCELKITSNEWNIKLFGYQEDKIPEIYDYPIYIIQNNYICPSPSKNHQLNHDMNVFFKEFVKKYTNPEKNYKFKCDNFGYNQLKLDPKYIIYGFCTIPTDIEKMFCQHNKVKESIEDMEEIEIIEDDDEFEKFSLDYDNHLNVDKFKLDYDNHLNVDKFNLDL